MAGANDAAIEDVEVAARQALEATAGGDLSDDGSAGAGAGVAKPFGLVVHGCYDTTAAYELGATVAAVLAG